MDKGGLRSEFNFFYKKPFRYFLYERQKIAFFNQTLYVFVKNRCYHAKSWLACSENNENNTMEYVLGNNFQYFFTILLYICTKHWGGSHMNPHPLLMRTTVYLDYRCENVTIVQIYHIFTSRI